MCNITHTMVELMLHTSGIIANASPMFVSSVNYRNQ